MDKNSTLNFKIGDILAKKMFRKFLEASVIISLYKDYSSYFISVKNFKNFFDWTKIELQVLKSWVFWRKKKSKSSQVAGTFFREKKREFAETSLMISLQQINVPLFGKNVKKNFSRKKIQVSKSGVFSEKKLKSPMVGGLFLRARAKRSAPKSHSRTSKSRSRMSAEGACT